MKKLVIIIISCLVLTGLLVWFGLAKPMYEDSKEIQQFCDNNNLYPCYVKAPSCFLDCEKLGKDYWKFDTGGFASSECWCKVNNKTEQIW